MAESIYQQAALQKATEREENRVPHKEKKFWENTTKRKEILEEYHKKKGNSGRIPHKERKFWENTTQRKEVWENITQRKETIAGG